MVIKPPDSFFFEAVKSFQSQYKNTMKKDPKTLLQQHAILKDANITDNDDIFW